MSDKEDGERERERTKGGNRDISREGERRGREGRRERWGEEGIDKEIYIYGVREHVCLGG